MKHFEQCSELLKREEWHHKGPLPVTAEQRKKIPIYSAFIRFFPKAIVEVTKKSMEGQRQHNPNGASIKWIRAASADDKDALMRHVLDEDWAAVAWRAMAVLEKHLEGEE